MPKSFDLDSHYAEFEEITGMDEAGRGSLAGPLAVASVTWNHHEVVKQPWFPKLGDSKTLSPKTRLELRNRIMDFASRVQVVTVSPILIDYFNVLGATLHGFKLVAPEREDKIPLIIDGNQKPNTMPWAKTQVKGDSRISAVAAAGIIAKVARDGLMTFVHMLHPKYGFDRNKGYGTQEHLQALADHGPTNQHRKTFRPVSDWNLPEGPEDPYLLEVPTDPDSLMNHWEMFARFYDRCSLSASRKALELMAERGLGVLSGPQEVWGEMPLPEMSAIDESGDDDSLPEAGS